MAEREYADTGYGPIDTEHRAISQQLQALINAIRADDTAAVKAQLTVLQSSVADHFAHEERLMVAHGFPKLVPHKQTHDLFLADVAAKAKAGREQGADGRPAPLGGGAVPGVVPLPHHGQRRRARPVPRRQGGRSGRPPTSGNSTTLPSSGPCACLDSGASPASERW